MIVLFSKSFFWIDDEPIPPTILCTKAEAFVRRNSFLLRYIRRNAPNSIHQEIVVDRSTDRPTIQSKTDERRIQTNGDPVTTSRLLSLCFNSFISFHFVVLCCSISLYFVMFRSSNSSSSSGSSINCVYTPKLDPHPQLSSAFGLKNLKPPPMSSSE